MLDFAQGVRVRFVGTDRDEYVSLPYARVTGVLGGGDDTIVGSFGPSGTEENLSGGAGDDRLVLRGGDVVFDTAAGTATGGPTYGTAVYDGYEAFHGVGRTVAMNGSEASEMVFAYGCDVTINGLGGDDDLTSYANNGALGDFNCEDTSSELFGGPGDDVMTGDNRTDTLIGGDGDDSADGGRGDDVCDAEVEVRCEG